MAYKRWIKKRVIVFAPEGEATRKFLDSLSGYFPFKYYKADIVRVFIEVRIKNRYRRIPILESSDPRELFKFWSLYKALRREQWWWSWKLR